MGRTQAIKSFVLASRAERSLCKERKKRRAISLFSGAGLSDLGYELAGFRFDVQVEVGVQRAKIGMDNFPNSHWIVDDLSKPGIGQQVVEKYLSRSSNAPDLLVATPPCQGMSSSNPSRGKRRTEKSKENERKNQLTLEVLPIARALKPRVILVENVRPILTHGITIRGREYSLLDYFRRSLKDYKVFAGVVDMADYGIPQTRKRAIIAAIRKDERFLKAFNEVKRLPWPIPTHGAGGLNGKQKVLSIGEWLRDMRYEPLDASSCENAIGSHPLHFVPFYGKDRYLQISNIPPNSGRNAFENSSCPTCGHTSVPIGLVSCPSCKSLMRNRPYVNEGDTFRLIKGFYSSYRRMKPDLPAPTVTTNSSHVGSDFKVHPWENRVLSILECADLQTVPRFYNWSRPLSEGRTYLIRTAIGEALPPYFSFLHGLLLYNWLSRSNQS